MEKKLENREKNQETNKVYRYNSESKKFVIDNPFIDNDTELQKINDEIQDLYSSYYYFDYNGQACYFDEK